MTLRDGNQQNELSDDAARTGVTGHNVRYVLAAGLTGIIAAFSVVAVYLGFDAVQGRMSAALSRSPSEWLQALAPYAAFAASVALLAGLLLGLWTLLAGRSDNVSQVGMRLRVVLQFAIVCGLLGMLYVTSH